MLAHLSCQAHHHVLLSPASGENVTPSLMLVGVKPTLNESSVHL